MGNYFYKYKFIAQVIGSFNDVELLEVSRSARQQVSRHRKNTKKITQSRFVPKLFYLKKCVNCDNSEFPLNSITGKK